MVDLNHGLSTSKSCSNFMWFAIDVEGHRSLDGWLKRTLAFQDLVMADSLDDEHLLTVQTLTTQFGGEFWESCCWRGSFILHTSFQGEQNRHNTTQQLRVESGDEAELDGRPFHILGQSIRVPMLWPHYIYINIHICIYIQDSYIHTIFTQYIYI